MTVTFRIPTILQRYSAGEDSVAVEGSTVGQALESLWGRHPDLMPRVLDERGELYPYLHLFHNGARLAHEGLAAVAVEAGDTLDLIGAVEGGSGASLQSDSEDRDVRMRGFRERASVETALAVALDGAVSSRAEEVSLTEAAGRVLAESITSDVDVPSFRRSAMDGYALVAEDTFGASLYDPVRLRVVGESMPGAARVPAIGRGEACRIMTGARLPDGADAVLPAEDAGEHAGELEARAAVAPGKHVGRVGEDVERGATVLTAGRRLRPQDAGLAASIGRARVLVRARPRVTILVSGNELLAPGEPPRAGFVADSNTPMLKALLERDGGTLLGAERLPDDPDVLRRALAAARDRGADVLLAAGGSSVGREDHLPMLVRELGRLPVHGIAIRPASPTGIGTIGGARVFLLPGNPVSCLCAYDFFAGPAVRTLAGLPAGSPYAKRRLPLSKRITSRVGRVDYVRVRVHGAPPAVEPLGVTGASVLSSTTRADGFVVVPAASEGFDEGQDVTVLLYDSPPGA